MKVFNLRIVSERVADDLGTDHGAVVRHSCNVSGQCRDIHGSDAGHVHIQGQIILAILVQHLLVHAGGILGRQAAEHFQRKIVVRIDIDSRQSSHQRGTASS